MQEAQKRIADLQAEVKRLNLEIQKWRKARDEYRQLADSFSASVRMDGKWCLPCVDSDSDLEFLPVSEWLERCVPVAVRREIEKMRKDAEAMKRDPASGGF